MWLVRIYIKYKWYSNVQKMYIITRYYVITCCMHTFPVTRVVLKLEGGRVESGRERRVSAKSNIIKCAYQ